MAAIQQLGTGVMIGFQGETFSGYLQESVDKEQTAEQKVIKDEDNATHTVLVEDEGVRITFTAIVLAGSTPETIRQGDTVTVDSVGYRCESSSVSYNAEEARLSITAIKEDSITY